MDMLTPKIDTLHCILLLCSRQFLCQLLLLPELHSRFAWFRSHNPGYICKTMLRARIAGAFVVGKTYLRLCGSCS